MMYYSESVGETPLYLLNFENGGDNQVPEEGDYFTEMS